MPRGIVTLIELGSRPWYYRGEFYTGLSKFAHKVASVEAAELMAGVEAIQFAINAGFRKIRLKCDNIYVIDDIKSYEDGLSSGTAIVADIVGWAKGIISLVFLLLNMMEILWPML